jgi:HTH-type transcriptional regulator, competence development regulator
MGETGRRRAIGQRAPGESLGAYLRALREAAGLTLRAVAAECIASARCGVSNGYLSLLEQDKVVAPNPNVLWSLAACYGADYRELMRRAGYPMPDPTAGPEHPRVIFAGSEELTPDEREEIQEIIAMKLRRRRRSGSAEPAISAS